MPSKFSEFARDTKKFEKTGSNATNAPGEKADSVPAKDKNPDDLEIQ